jgi:hypothetical protein
LTRIIFFMFCKFIIHIVAFSSVNFPIKLKTSRRISLTWNYLVKIWIHVIRFHIEFVTTVFSNLYFEHRSRTVPALHFHVFYRKCHQLITANNRRCNYRFHERQEKRHFMSRFLKFRTATNFFFVHRGNPVAHRYIKNWSHHLRLSRRRPQCVITRWAHAKNI